MTEVAKRMAPFFKDLTQYLDDTDWMYPTPRTFRPYQPHATTTSSSTREAPLDLPVFQSPHESHNQMQEAADLANRMRHLRVFPVTGPTEDPHQGSSDAARMDTPARERQKAFSAFVESLGEAEAELEMSFANDSIAGGARNAHLIREVSMLGV